MNPRHPYDVTCEQVVERVSGYLEGVLPSGQAGEVRSHLEICSGCQIYLDQMRATIEVLGAVPVETLSDRAKSDLLAAFRDPAAR